MRLFHLLWLFILWLKMEKSLQSDVIKCRVPVIENGNVPGDTQEYNEHEVLHFECNPNYIPTDQRPTTCTIQRGRAEWIPTPYCETTKCRLTLPPLEGTSYEPAYRNLFSPGDTVKVICGERYGISNLQNASATVTCKDDGKWTVRPLCIEVTCSNRRDPLVDNWHVQRITLTGTARYTCKSGYRSKDGTNMATCTRDGWRPNPLCQATHCPVMHVDDNILVDGSLERAALGNVVRFSCKSNTDILFGPTEIYCDESGSWSGDAPKCKEITCKREDIPHANIVNSKWSYKYNELAKYECEEGYRGSPTRTCGENGWNGDSHCTEITCEQEDIPHAVIVNPKWRYTNNQQADYECEEGYKGRPTRTCRENGWTGDSQCTEIICDRQDIPHANIVNGKWRYKYNELADYVCEEGYRGSPTQTCRENGWTGNSQCTEITCEREDIPHANIVNSKWSYKYNELAKYECEEGYRGSPTRTCGENGWTGDSHCTEIICEGQDIPHANIVNPKWRYKNNQRADYECEEGYRGSPTRTCRENGWTGDSQCTEIICERQDISHANIVNGKWRYKNNELANYVCEEGYRGSPTRTCRGNGWIGDSQCTVEE